MLVTLIVGIVCMVVGYYLGVKETDKKWIEKGPKPSPGCSAPVKEESITEKLRRGEA